MLDVYVLCGEKDSWSVEDIEEATGIKDLLILVNCDFGSISENEIVNSLASSIRNYVWQEYFRYKIFKKLNIKCNINRYMHFYKPQAIVLSNTGIDIVASKNDYVAVPICHYCNIQCDDKYNNRERIKLADLLYYYLTKGEISYIAQK